MAEGPAGALGRAARGAAAGGVGGVPPGAGGRGARPLAVMWAVLDEMHAEHCAAEEAEAAGEPRRAVAVPERDLYYRLKSRGEVRNCEEVARAVARAGALLGVRREDLGVVSSGGKGEVAGSIRIWAGASWHDCRAQGRFSVPGDPRVVANLRFQTSARFILVVEKETVFSRLLGEQLDALMPIALVTGRGFPDVPTRTLLHHLATAFPHVPVVGLADWNPHGVAIMSLYKFGYVKRAASEYNKEVAVPRMVWLGLHRKDFPESCPTDEFTPRDRALAETLLTAAPAAELPAWALEVRAMAAGVGRKVDIEGICAHKQLAPLLMLKLLEGDWV